MSKIRVHELAKELNKTSKDVIYALKRHGVTVESHMTMIPGDYADRIRRYFQQPAQMPKREGRPAPEKQAKAPSAPQGSGRIVGLDSKGNFSMMSEDEMPKAPREVKPKTEAAAEKAADQTPREGQNREGQNRDGQGRDGARPFNRDGQGRDGQGRDGQGRAGRMNRDGQGRDGQGRDGSRQFNRDGRSRDGQGRDGARPYNRDGQNRDGQGRDGARPYNRDGQGRDGARPYNRDGQNRDGQGRDGARPYNRDGQNRDGQGRDGARPFNRDGQGRDGGRPFNKDGGRNDGQRSFNRDGGGRDGQSRGGQNRGGQGRGFSIDKAIDKEVVVTKDTGRENRRNYNKENKDKDNRRDEREFGGKNGKNKNSQNNAKNNKQAGGHKKPMTTAPKPAPVVEKVTSIEVGEMISIKDLADKMKISAASIIKDLFMAGKMYNLNSDISFEEAEEIALNHDILCEHEVVVDVIEEMLKEEDENEEDMITRPPVVCVMGHVDHGKTSILDAIRKTSVTAGEAGGITQHIGAYTVEANGQKITFLDTPGHEAFTAMRLRGAQSTDIAILVVAADDGVMPQTIEAINHAKAAGIDIIVAINKIDKPSANIDRVKQELTEYELVAEDWGGSTIMVPVSAHTGEGLSDLLDMVLLDAEVKELKANPNRRGRGLILEAQLDKGRGPVATVLVQKGTINVGDNVTVGTAYGKIRAMIDDKGRRVKKAGPSTPVEILGLNAVPNAGEVFIATETEKEARSMAETFIATNREKMLAETKAKLSLDSLFDQIQEGQIKDLNIVVKADVQGSVEAVKQSLAKLSNDEVAVKIIHGGVGAINESDVTLASASNAIIIGFNVRPDNQAKIVAEQEHVDMRLYRVIYNAIEDIEAAMKGMLEPTFAEKIIGHAEVRATYKVSGVGTIIGGYVQDGKIVRNCKVRLLRDNVVIHDGELASLKRFKDDVKEVNSGYECGMSFEKYNDIKEGDQIEAYVMEEVPR